MIIAVTDLDEFPESCETCPIASWRAVDFGECPITGDTIDEDEMKERLYSCPLKEVDGV